MCCANEEKRLLPHGVGPREPQRFQLLCGTNRDLRAAVARGTFREDPPRAHQPVDLPPPPALHERPEDLPQRGLRARQASSALGVHVMMNREARALFLEFAASWLVARQLP